MLSNFTINKIKEEPEAFNDLMWYWEKILGINFEGTDKISEYIDNTYINRTIIYNDDIKDESESEFIKYFNKEYGTNYKTLDEIQENESIDVIRGDEIYAVI